jgi:DNA-binding beta-propeller fold protein YncE
LAAAAAAVLVAACGSSASGPKALALALPAPIGPSARLSHFGGCSTAVAPARALAGARTAMVALGGPPFGIASTRDGRWSFVDELPGKLLVFSDAGFKPQLVRTIAVPGAAVGNALTADGRYLLIAGGGGGAAGASDVSASGASDADAIVVSVARAESGAAGAVLGGLRGAVNGAGRGPIEVTSSPDGHYAFVSIEYANEVAVYDLRAAIASGFAKATYIGSVPLGQSVVGMAVSPDGRWLYVTSELAAGARNLNVPGTLSVLSIAKAGRDPARAVVATVAAQCQPVRVVVTANGQTVWVTARASDDLLAFSAAKLLRDPAAALIAAVRVGEAPVGLALIDGDRLIVVADSNRFHATGASSALTVVDAADTLAGKPAILGTIPAGAFPREMSLEGDGQTLLVGNFASEQLEAVELPSRGNQ